MAMSLSLLNGRGPSPNWFTEPSSHAGAVINLTSGIPASSFSNVERGIWELYGTRKVQQGKHSFSFTAWLLLTTKD